MRHVDSKEEVVSLNLMVTEAGDMHFTTMSCLVIFESLK